MNLLVQLIEHLGNLICMVFMVRILLQIAQADFNNPISQFVHKFTYPAINPLRSVIPDLGKFNTAALLIILVVILIKLGIFHFGFGLPLNGNQLIIGTFIAYLNPGYIQLAGFISILVTLLTVLFIGLMVTSFLAGGQYNPALMFFHQVTRPLLRPLQKIIPPIGGAIDITPMILLFVLLYLQKALMEFGLRLVQ
ncbi:MAG: YggT family protein [Kangiellaceae bacterium]|nr:YggT family protein [Kangiellaceae bacterium]